LEKLMLDLFNEIVTYTLSSFSTNLSGGDNKGRRNAFIEGVHLVICGGGPSYGSG
jgi:hypothetical protein